MGPILDGGFDRTDLACFHRTWVSEYPYAVVYLEVRLAGEPAYPSRGLVVSPEDLLNMAEGLATGAVSYRRGRPRRADLNRAVSSIYYALFHCLAACGADLLVGRTRGSRSETAWRQTYRALEHGRLRRQCAHTGNIAGFPYEVRKFAFLIVQM